MPAFRPASSVAAILKMLMVLALLMATVNLLMMTVNLLMAPSMFLMTAVMLFAGSFAMLMFLTIRNAGQDHVPRHAREMSRTAVFDYKIFIENGATIGA